MALEVGEIVEGKVTGITKFGAFVEIEEGKTGLVHISEVANVFVKEVGDHVKEGQTVKVKILGLNNNGKIELSIKKADENLNSSGEKSEKFNSKRNFNNFNRERPKNRNNSSANSFEEMITKFKKLSDEKLSDFKKKTEPRRGKPNHKNG